MRLSSTSKQPITPQHTGESGEEIEDHYKPKHARRTGAVDLPKPGTATPKEPDRPAREPYQRRSGREQANHQKEQTGKATAHSNLTPEFSGRAPHLRRTNTEPEAT
jgi:hypothetical protein